jgi:hypothetical protein
MHVRSVLESCNTGNGDNELPNTRQHRAGWCDDRRTAAATRVTGIPTPAVRHLTSGRAHWQLPARQTAAHRYSEDKFRLQPPGVVKTLGREEARDKRRGGRGWCGPAEGKRDASIKIPCIFTHLCIALTNRECAPAPALCLSSTRPGRCS